MPPGRRTSSRVQAAASLLLSGRGASSVVAELARTRGISHRSAQRDVAAAYQLIEADMEPIDRRQLLAQLIDNTQQAVAQALATKNSGAAIAGVRCLADLLGMTTTNH
jgi:methylphosphotriester-DNA--protein-cysteine methyltransferase